MRITFSSLIRLNDIEQIFILIFALKSFNLYSSLDKFIKDSPNSPLLSKNRLCSQTSQSSRLTLNNLFFKLNISEDKSSSFSNLISELYSNFMFFNADEF